MKGKKIIHFALIVIFISITAYSINPVSNCLGNCIACHNTNPLICKNGVDASTGKKYFCLKYYTGQNCSQTVSSYYNLYKQVGSYVNWSLPTPPPSQTCQLLVSNTTNNTNNTNSTNGNLNFTSIGPFSSKLNATKSLYFTPAQNIQRLIIKISVAINDGALFNESITSNQTSTEITDAQGNIIIQTITTTNQNTTLSKIIPFLNLAVTDQINSNKLITTLKTFYDTVSQTNTSCGFVYQYQFTVDTTDGNPFKQILLNFYLSSPNSQTTWYLLGFTVQGGCSGFAVTQGANKCQTCLSGFFPTYDPDNNLTSCGICDYRCSTCSGPSTCILCQAYTVSKSSGVCEYPSSYRIYKSFKALSGIPVNLTTSSSFNNLLSSLNQVLNIGQTLANDQSYFIKFYLLYTQNLVNSLSQFIITVNGKPYSTYSALDLYSSTLLKQVNNGGSQLYFTVIKIDLMGKKSLSNFSIGLKANTATPTNQQFYVGNLVLVQYSCGQNCANCSFNPTLTTTAVCNQCTAFFSKSQNCKTCANGFFLKDQQTCVKCYSNCKQCVDQNINSCTDCLNNFVLSGIIYNQTCISCLYNFYKNNSHSCNSSCTKSFTMESLNYIGNCSSCFKLPIGSIFIQAYCQNCWVKLGLAKGKCVPSRQSGYTYYSNDLPNGKANTTLWKGSQKLSALNCTTDYINIYGIPQNNNHTLKKPASITYNLGGLPTHRGVIFILNIFKIDDWFTNQTAATSNTTQIITVTVSSPGYQGNSFNIEFTNLYGADICSSSGREMIWAIQTQLNDHAGDSISLNISAPDEGIFVRELQLYLGNCVDCQSVALSYSIFALPIYSDNNTQTGLDTWITFNHPVYFNSQSNLTQPDIIQKFIQSYVFTVGNTPVNSSVKSNQLSKFNYIKYFIPLNNSFINTTLTASTDQGNLIYTQDGTISRQLVSSSQSIQVQRYDNASPDTRLSVSQSSNFFLFFTWFALIVMIICILLGFGVIFQQFSIMMQLIYYHIYITSTLLPPTIKIPLSNAVRMQHLNYFANIQSIENDLFGNLGLNCDYIFQQYNIDVFFIRSYYPILIINAIFIIWYIIHGLFYILIVKYQQSSNKLLRFIRSIPQRPINYFDQIWRYQFLATMWACFLQFSNFTSNGGGQSLGLAICILAFVVSILWPIVITVYTYRKHYTMNIKHFRYCYHDLYYLKISSVADQPKYYLYRIVRFGKYLIYAIFISMFINQTIIGPVLLIFANFIQGITVFFLNIYRSGYYAFTRIVENTFLIIAAILCLVIFGIGNNQSIDQNSFQNLGYGLTTIFILMVINGIARFFYLIYKKYSEWKMGTYDTIDAGQKDNYDGKPIPIPQSQRI